MKKQSLLPVLLIVSLGGLFGQSVDNTSTGTMVDARDGHRYKWVRIGMQTWMEENLAWLPSVSKHETGSETQSHYYVYGYEGTSVKEAKSNSNYKTYGVLYNWEAAKKACPSGWHLPTDLEWKTLEKYTGMSESDADAKGWRYSGAVGGKLKESESSHWSNPNIGANNRSGFTALPGEFRNDKEDSNSLGGWAAFWSASRDGMSGAWTRWLSDDLDAVSRHCDSLDYGFSVRCLQTKSSTSTVLIPDTIVKPSDPARINAQDNQSILKKMNQRIAEVDLLYAKTNVSEERAKLMKEKAELLYEKSATDRNFLFQAIECMNVAKSHAEKANNQILHSQILGALGNLYRQTNRFSEAYEYYQTASKIVKGIDFKTYFAAEFDKNSLVCQRLLEGDKLFLLLSRMEAKSNIDPENCCVENYERLAAEAKSANAIDLEFLSYSNMYYFIENNTDKIEITGGKKEQIEEHILRTSFEVVKLKAETYIQKQALVYIIDLYSAKLDRSRSLIVIEGIVSQLTSIEEIVKKNYNPQQVCEFELLIGSARTRIKIEVNRAIDNFKEALRLRPTTGPGSQEKLSFIVSKLVELLTYKGDYDKARSIISFCLDQKIGNKAEWFMVAGNIEDEQGNYNNAFECYSNAKLVEERTHDDYLKALILYNESFVYRNVGEFGKSQNNLFQCLDILGDELFSMIGFKEQHPIPPISSYLEYYMKKDMEFLVQYSSNKYSNPGKLNNTLNYIINCYDELGKNYMGINDLVMARSFFERSSKLFQRLNAKLFIGFKTVYGSVETTLNLVKISLAESDTSAARGYFKYYHEKLRSADVDLERPFLKSDFSLLEAYYYMSLNNYQEAKRLGLEALRLTEEYNLADKRLETLALLFRITTHLKENSESDYYFISITKALKDFIPSIFPGLGENEKLAFITKAEDYSDLLGSFVLKESTRNPQLKIWYSDYILFYKKLVLSNVVSLKKNILESDDPILGNLYDEYMGVRNDLQKLYVFRDNSNSGLKPKVDSLNNRIVELERQLSFKSEEFASSIDTTITWNKIRDELKENEALIEFIRIKNLNQPGSQDSTLYAALITRPGVKYPEFIPLCGDDQLFRTLYDIEAPNERRFRLETTDEILATQYQLIWKPMEKILSGVSKIYLSTTGWLNSVSFQALKKYENSYLIDSLEIYYLLSSREFVSKRFQNEPKKPFTAALFGGIVYDLDSTFMIRDAKRGGIESNQSYLPESDSRSNRSFGYLQGTRNEIIKVNNFLSGRNCKTILFTDTLATERQFKKLTGKEAPEILHIATHGFYLQPGIKKDQKPNVFNIGPEFLLADDALKRSGLAMAGANLAWKGMKLPGGVEDGILTAYEVSNMDLRNTGLVLLSACETGLGDMQNSEGVFGLQRAFRKAGAQAVIMSLWNVDDQSTAQLMSKFFELWMKGASRAVAFNLAVKELRREYSGEPSKWAAFVLVN